MKILMIFRAIAVTLIGIMLMSLSTCPQAHLQKINWILEK